MSVHQAADNLPLPLGEGRVRAYGGDKALFSFSLRRPLTLAFSQRRGKEKTDFAERVATL